jgi:RNA polymerase sigma-70 factor (ECF subfamily)
MDGLSSYSRFLSGDNEGLGELVEMYNHSLILFINGYVRDIFVSEDLAADTFMEILVKRYKFNQTAKFKTWLFKIARNNAYDYLRKQSRTYTIGIDDVAEITDKNHSPEQALLTSERDAQLHKAIKSLPEDYSRTMYLLYFENMGYDEIGKVLKKSNRQIKNIAYRARLALKDILIKEGFQDYETITD